MTNNGTEFEPPVHVYEDVDPTSTSSVESQEYDYIRHINNLIEIKRHVFGCISLYVCHVCTSINAL